MGLHTPVGFDEQKAAQLAALLASKSPVGMDKLKLIKLIYLVEREFVSRHGHPMLFDDLYSLEHGPICSSALSGLNLKLNERVWRGLICKAGDTISARIEPTRGRLDHLSNAELKVAESVWEKFGHMSASDLRRFTHDNCAEYVEVPKGKRMQISYKDLFAALGFEDPDGCEERVVDVRRAHNILSY